MTDRSYQKNRFRINSTWLLIGAMVIGFGLLIYPTAADCWNSFHQSQAVSSYMESVASIDNKAFKEMWAEAVQYNNSLLTNDHRYIPSAEEIERYNSILNVNSTGIMSYIEIPSLKISLPVYHGTSDAVLKVAVGHIEGSSLPVGGSSTHCVISGHRGLPSARLFTDIDRLVNGDTFILDTLGETLTYEVDQIRIVLPNELEDIEIEEGKDYCTLVTCTPYGVNSHRLLVRGHRVSSAKEHIHVTAEAVQIDPSNVAIGFGILILVLFGLATVIQDMLRNRRKHSWTQKN